MTKGTVRRSGRRIVGSRADSINTTGPRYTLLDNAPKCNQPVVARRSSSNAVPSPASLLRGPSPASCRCHMAP